MRNIQVEAEGSDAFREYGPPKTVEVSQDLTKQELPDVSTEQAFVVLDLARISENEVVAEAVVEEKEEEKVQEENVNANSDIVTDVQETTVSTDEEVVVDTQETVTGVENIAETLANLENEQVQQVTTNTIIVSSILIYFQLKFLYLILYFFSD